MFFIRKKMPRPHALGEPILHENHRKPVTRRELLGAGLKSAPALVVGPAWLGAMLKANKANGTTINFDDDITKLLTVTAGTKVPQCGIATASNATPVILFRSRRWCQPGGLRGPRRTEGWAVEFPDHRRLRQDGFAGQHGAVRQQHFRQQRVRTVMAFRRRDSPRHADKGHDGGDRREHQRCGDLCHVPERHGPEYSQPDVRHHTHRRSWRASEPGRQRFLGFGGQLRPRRLT